MANRFNIFRQYGITTLQMQMCKRGGTPSEGAWVQVEGDPVLPGPQALHVPAHSGSEVQDQRQDCKAHAEVVWVYQRCFDSEWFGQLVLML